MKSSTFFWRLFFSVFLICVQAFGQGTNPIMSMDVVANPIRNNFSQDSLPLITDCTIYQVGMNLNLYDSIDMQSVDVKIGSTEDGPEFFSHVFSFDVSGSLVGGLTYVRNGCSIQLDFG